MHSSRRFLGSADRRRFGISSKLEIWLPTFYIGRYRVTVAQFRAFVEEAGYELKGDALDGVRNHSVVIVTRPDASAHCDWLNEQLEQWEGTTRPLAQVSKHGRMLHQRSREPGGFAELSDDELLRPCGELAVVLLSSPRPLLGRNRAARFTEPAPHHKPQYEREARKRPQSCNHSGVRH